MYLHTRHAPSFSRRGQIIADKAGHAFINNGFSRAYKFNDAAKANKTLDTLCSELRENGYYFELTYDAAHGRRYIMIVFRLSIDRDIDKRQAENRGARKMALTDFLCAPENSFYHSPAF